jgi:hypothetical protein
MMKTLSILCLLLFYSSLSSAQLQQSRWIHHTEKGDLYIEFDNNTFHFGIVNDYRPLNLSTYRVEGDTLKLIDLSGGALCEASKTETGVYLINTNEAMDSLSFSLLHDECLGRGELLNELLLVLDKPAAFSAIDYVVIQMDDEEIFVKSKYKPYQLTITDSKGINIQSVESSNYIPIKDLKSGEYTLQVWNDYSLQYAKKFYLE